MAARRRARFCRCTRKIDHCRLKPGNFAIFFVPSVISVALIVNLGFDNFVGPVVGWLIGASGCSDCSDGGKIFSAEGDAHTCWRCADDHLFDGDPEGHIVELVRPAQQYSYFIGNLLRTTAAIHNRPVLQIANVIAGLTLDNATVSVGSIGGALIDALA